MVFKVPPTLLLHIRRKIRLRALWSKPGDPGPDVFCTPPRYRKHSRKTEECSSTRCLYLNNSCPTILTLLLAMLDLSQSRLTEIHIPRIGIALALHRRGNSWYMVLPRAYGMAGGNKFFGCLNSPQLLDSTPDPSLVQQGLKPRFWLRDGSDWEYGSTKLTIDGLLQSDPPIFKDSGVRRKVELKENGMIKMIEERLVEVLLKESELCQRCAWCGCWELSYEGESRHCQRGVGTDGRPLYWCGVSNSLILLYCDLR
jgi:hypothetical protein